ncbi:MAG: hypothetical protein CMP48_25235 [Rickettsiales bacterium]|nr:hypothetical protein [Rickettsiales bacterium]
MIKSLLYTVGLIIAVLCFSQEKEHIYSVDDYSEKTCMILDLNEYVIGENIHYHIFHVQSNTFGEPLSKIVYIDVKDRNDSLILHEVVKLIDGVGEGDMYIPSSIKTDNYKVIAYSKWNMSQYYGFDETIITIINPLEPYKNPSSSREQSMKWWIYGNKLTANLPAQIIYSLDNQKPSLKLDLITGEGEIVQSIQNPGQSNEIRFTPKIGQTYLLRLVDLTNGSGKDYKLPEVSLAGISLVESHDSLIFRFSSSIVPKEIQVNALARPEKVRFSPSNDHSITIPSASLQALNQSRYIELNAIHWSNQVEFLGLFQNAGYQKGLTEILNVQSRDSLQLNLEEFMDTISGKVSISISKKEQLADTPNRTIPDILNMNGQQLAMPASTNYMIMQRESRSIALNESSLPDFRGWLIEMESSDSSTLASPKSEYFITSGISEEKSTFYNYNIDYLSEGPYYFNSTDIDTLMSFKSNKTPLKIPTLKLNKEDIPYINRRMMEVQVGLYWDINNYKTIQNKPHTAFYGMTDDQYRTDEYISLSSIREFIMEVIRNVRVIQRNKQNPSISISTIDGIELTNQPLVLINYLPVNNLQTFLDIPSDDVESVDLVRRTYNYNDSQFGGVINFIMKPDRKGQIERFGIKTDLNIDSGTKNYLLDDFSYKPDFRRNLYFDLTTIDPDTKTISIVPSLLSGAYVLKVNGLSSSNTPFYFEKEIVVK